MSYAPWWIARVSGLLSPGELGPLELGPLWHLRERLAFVRENVETEYLELDFARVPGARQVWAEFLKREQQVQGALTRSSEGCASRLRSGELGPGEFRAGWEALGFERHEGSAGTPADDYLDGLMHLSRYTEFETPAPLALLNLATRASRVADFLAVTEPAASDVVFDLGSGSGKLAITVAASTLTTVRGVEIEPVYAAEARGSSERLGLGNVAFDQADVRDVDLGGGSIFYLYYPFHGAIAQGVAQRLGALARQKDITIYASGPERDYGEFFLSEVDGGALVLAERRGEFGEVMLLRSALA